MNFVPPVHESPTTREPVELSVTPNLADTLDAYRIASMEYRRLAGGNPGMAWILESPVPFILIILATCLVPFGLGEGFSALATACRIPAYLAVSMSGWVFNGFVILGFGVLPALVVWANRGALRETLTITRPDLQLRVPIPTRIRFGAGFVEVETLARRSYWPVSACLSLVETADQFVLLLNENIVPIPKRDLDPTTLPAFHSWMADYDRLPRKMRLAMRHPLRVAALCMLGGGVVIAGMMWMTHHIFKSIP
jgi:hypothetical protein